LHRITGPAIAEMSARPISDGPKFATKKIKKTASLASESRDEFVWIA